MFYELIIRFYYLLVLIASSFNPKARKWINGRKQLFKQLKSGIGSEDKIIWFHASSLGEFEQGRPVIEAYKEKKPEYKILLTFFSPSGYEVRKNYEGADYIFYLPLDTQKNVRLFLDIVRPHFAVFIKYDFWFNFLRQLSNRKITTLLISAKFRPSQAFFKAYGFWYRKLLKYFDHLFVQDDQSIQLLSNIHIGNVTKSGDTRFDRVRQIASQSVRIQTIEDFVQGRFTIVCGSTWAKDEELIARYIDEVNREICFIIVPHEVHPSHIKGIQERIKSPATLYSDLLQGTGSKAQVLIIDNIGMLSKLYKYCNIAYIGGGFGAGIHNILEAAVYNVPVIFGPNYQKFREANELITLGGAFSCSSYFELSGLFNSLVEDYAKLSKASEIAGQYIISNLGATDQIVRYLENL